MFLATDKRPHRTSNDIVRNATTGDHSTSLPHSLKDHNPFSSTFHSSSFCPCGGGCPTCRGTFNTEGIRYVQPKLKVGQPDDPLEREADQASERIMNFTNHTPKVGKDDWKPIEPRRKSLGNRDELEVSDRLSNEIRDVISDGGEPLDTKTKEFMESRFRFEFGNVKVHADVKSNHLANSVESRAFTLGNNIFLSSEESKSDKKLLAHELTHVIQQKASAPKLSLIQRAPPKSTPPPVSASEDFSRIYQRLEDIIRNGGPVPGDANWASLSSKERDKGRVIGAAIIDASEGYNGPREIRAISSLATDRIVGGAPVYHATGSSFQELLELELFVPTTGIPQQAPGRPEFRYSHMNDAEVKMFTAIFSFAQQNARGNIHILAMSVRLENGVAVFEPVPLCSGCTKASFEAVTGSMPGFNLISHSPTHTPTLIDISRPEEKPFSSRVRSEARGKAPRSSQKSAGAKGTEPSAVEIDPNAVELDPEKLATPSIAKPASATRATAGAVLVIQGLNVAFNIAIDVMNKRRMQEDADERDLEIAAIQTSSPEMGILYGFIFTGGADSGEGPTASARYDHLEIATGRTRDEAEANWNRKDIIAPGHGFSSVFYYKKPIKPTSVEPQGWQKVAHATFNDLSKIQFTSVGFKVGDGFYLRSRGLFGLAKPPTFNISNVERFPGPFEFFVLKLPPKIASTDVVIQNAIVAKGLEPVSYSDIVTVSEKDTFAEKKAGVPVVIIEGEPIVAVVAANEITRQLFNVDSFAKILDKQGNIHRAASVYHIVDVEEVRWLKPSQVRVLKSL